MFREMDELFAHLYTRITRDFTAGEPQAFGYHLIIQHCGETSPVPYLQRNQLRANSEPVVEIHRIGDEVKVITELPGTTMDAIGPQPPGIYPHHRCRRGFFAVSYARSLPPVDFRFNADLV